MPTIRRCCIVGCMSNSRLNPNLQFFQFPRPDNPFYKLWTQACQASLSRILPFKKPVLCAEHFHPHCIGGRRLTSSAVPTLKLEVPTNLKAVEQQAMVEEIERSRKFAYINAVVYEWLVRANLNPQLRGSITHGMIKEKAETAKQIVGCESFTADNRWLNRFRESHLSGFAQKLASNQLKPMGPSLWIPDIVQDLQHLFPPTTADRIENFENVPEQYINYMKQYGEYDEDEDDAEQDQSSSGYGSEQSNSYPEPKMPQQSYYPPHHPGSSYYQQPQQHPPPQHHQSPPPHPPPNVNGYNPYDPQVGPLHHPATSYNAYQDYYANERHHQQHYQPPLPPPPHHNGPYVGQPPIIHQQQLPPRPMSHSPPQPLQQQTPPPLQQQTPLATQPPPRPVSNSSSHNIRTSPTDPLQIDRTSSPVTKRPYPSEHSNGSNTPGSKRSTPILNSSSSSQPSSPKRSTPNGTIESNNNNIDNFKIKLPPINGNGLVRNSTPNPPSSPANVTNINCRSNTPKSQSDKCNATIDRNSSDSPPSPSSLADTNTTTKELETYAQALEYLKPLEDFALFKENFRAIGLISQLETILRKYNRPSIQKAVVNKIN